MLFIPKKTFLRSYMRSFVLFYWVGWGGVGWGIRQLEEGKATRTYQLLKRTSTWIPTIESNGSFSNSLQEKKSVGISYFSGDSEFLYIYRIVHYRDSRKKFYLLPVPGPQKWSTDRCNVLCGQCTIVFQLLVAEYRHILLTVSLRYSYLANIVRNNNSILHYSVRDALGSIELSKLRYSLAETDAVFNLKIALFRYLEIEILSSTVTLVSYWKQLLWVPSTITSRHWHTETESTVVFWLFDVLLDIQCYKLTWLTHDTVGRIFRKLKYDYLRFRDSRPSIVICYLELIPYFWLLLLQLLLRG